ncbi:LolA family protein [Gluconobacter morbifer]|uniref:Outer-membrane lipoprotein carrier protein n=1 Tax=Gluconobacter morbifer G707 TaxID=1088869 RepID=G6XI92_9PROT|nr:outer membrane lipoprotein carrier protein LolA [Gluconobacter morbifer]EHH68532.1 outer-membrane lipoprotein carrier protein [Gluconobacter morbifer G707]
MKRAFCALLLLSGCATSGYDRMSAGQQQDVHRIETYLNGIGGMRAAFIQNGPDAGQSEGRFSYSPGHLRLDYVIPHPMELVAGKGHLVLDDAGSGAVTHLSLKRNPLGLLLHQPIRFDNGSIQVTDVRHGDGSLQISVAEADNPSQGLLTIQFSDMNGRLGLIGLEGVDARQHHFSVSLSDVQEGVRIDPTVFTPPGG